ncbi:MAG: FAD-dependent oxidoreductase [Candidatus Obscuribacterales bacterium]|nr:FAD-dependent oxidoreductase [Candidatus Obscuribacterales bacterium]
MLANSKPTLKKIVIVGGVAGGMSAAARARRLSEKSEIIVLERSGYVSYANCGLPYFLGGEIESREDLVVQTPASLLNRFNLDIRVHHEVAEIDAKAKQVSIKNLTTGNTYRESYDDLILSTGASPIRPRVKGIDSAGVFALRSIEDVDSIQSWLDTQKPRRAVIAGGGFIGLEMAEQLTRKGLSVTLIDSKDQVLAPIDPEMAAHAHSELRKHGVKLVLGAPISAFLAPEEKVSSVADTPKSCWVLAGDNAPVPADIVILGLGIRPEVSLARKAGLVIGKQGGIRVNEKLQTSSPHIWAVGDAIEVHHPLSGEWTLIALGGPANRQGRIAANNILGASDAYCGTIGTAVLRIFDLTVASVGLNEGQLKTSTIPYELVYVHPTNHASYYPGAARLDMKVLFHKETGVLLGAQVIGKDGTDKRIDVLATAIKAHMTIRDIAELELAYAPPFGSAKDPINLAGMTGTNLLDGFLEQVHYHQIAALRESGVCLIDVRSDEERARGFIDGSIHIPLPELRKRLLEIPSGTNVVTYCQSGQRSYIAYRVLKQNGFNVKNLSGGYLTWASNLSADQNAPFAQGLAPSAVASHGANKV